MNSGMVLRKAKRAIKIMIYVLMVGFILLGLLFALVAFMKSGDYVENYDYVVYESDYNYENHVLTMRILVREDKIDEAEKIAEYATKKHTKLTDLSKSMWGARTYINVNENGDMGVYLGQLKVAKTDSTRAVLGVSEINKYYFIKN